MFLLPDFMLAVQTLTGRVDGDKWNCIVRMAWGGESEEAPQRENEFL